MYTRRLKVDIGKTCHGQRLRQTAGLSRQPPVIFDTQQHMRGFAPMCDEHGP